MDKQSSTGDSRVDSVTGSIIKMLPKIDCKHLIENPYQSTIIIL